MMNQRIQILAKQAGISTNHDIGLLISDPDKWVNHFSEKFAELIVQECLLALEPNLYESDIEYRVDQAFYNKCKRIIINHFKVKE